MLVQNPRLTFKKMRILNFGPFVGEHEMLFSVDKEKNVTLFLGDTGSGKSSIFQLMYWILFPSFDEKEMLKELKFFTDHNIKEAANSVVKRKIEVGNSFEVGGCIELEQIDRSGNLNFLELHRYIKFKKTAKGIQFANGKLKKSERKLIYKNASKVPNPDEIYLNLINKYFPRSMRDFVFIFGEGLNHLLSIENVGNLKNYSLDISDYPKIKTLQVYLDRASNYFQNKYLAVTAKGKKLKDKKEEIENFGKKKKELETKVAEKITELEIRRSELAELRNRRQNVQGKIDFVRDYNNLIQKLEEKAIRRDQIIERRERLLMQFLPILYLEQTMKRILKDIKEKREKDIIPGKLTSEVLQTILERHGSCVCGTPWNTEMKARINKILKKADNSILGETAIKFEAELGAKLKLLKTGKQSILENQKEFLKINQEVIEIKTKIDVLKTKLTPEEQSEEWYQEIIDLENQISLGDQLIGSIEQDKLHYLMEIDNIKNDKLNAEKQYNKMVSETDKSTDKSECYQKCRSLTEFYLKIISEIEENVAEVIRKKCEEETLETLKTLVRDPENWLSLNIKDIGKGWIFEAIFSSGSKIMNTSTGQTNIVGMSFISSLAKVLDVELPLIFDSPFGNIDSETRKQVVEKLPGIYSGNQIIFFAKENNLLATKPDINEIEDLRPIFDQKIGIKYEIENPKNDNAKLVRK